LKRGIKKKIQIHKIIQNKKKIKRMRFEFEKIAYYNYGSNDQIEKKKNLTNEPRTKTINKKNKDQN
jgi:hypothetical protein